MDTLAKKQKILDSFSDFIFADTNNGARLIIDIRASVLLCNDKALPISFTKGSSAISTLPELRAILTSPLLEKLIVQNSTLSYQISLDSNNDEHWYQLIVSPIFKSKDPLFLIEFVNISYFKSVETQANRQITRIENEILLRTKEIMHTSEAMEATGGYLNNFMRGLRHDLKSPITQLQEIIQYYQNATSPEKKKVAAEHIEASLQKLSNTARGLSDFVDLHFLPKSSVKILMVESICQNALDSLKNEIAVSGATINTDFSRADSLRFDEKILNSVFYNLISNSIKFRDLQKPLQIDISSKNVKNTFILTVKDNGIGLDLNRYRHLLFEPFKKLNTDIPGAGVGLSMLKSILDRNGGAIVLESEPDNGTTAIVTIPLNT